MIKSLCNLSELKDLSFGRQGLLSLAKPTRQYVSPDGITRHHMEVVLPGLIRTLHPVTNLHEMQRTEKHVKLYHRDKISKIET